MPEGRLVIGTKRSSLRSTRGWRVVGNAVLLLLTPAFFGPIGLGD